MVDPTANPLDPACPCASGRLLASCCAAAEGPEYSNEEVAQVVEVLARYGKRGEFAAALRRCHKDLAAPIPPVVADKLLAERELDMQLAFFFFTHADLVTRGGATIAQMALRAEGRSLASRPRALLANTAAQPTSLFEVLEVFPGQGLKMRDCLRRFTVRVHERQASHQIRPGWFLIVRVRLRPDGTPVMDPPMLQFEQSGREAVLDWLAEGDDEGGAVEPRSRLADLFQFWQLYMGELLMAPAPRLETFEGDEVVLCELKFSVADAPPVRKALRARGDWEPDEEGDDLHWTWFEPLPGGLRRGLAQLTFEPGIALVAAHSRERCAKVRELLEGIRGVRWIETKETARSELATRARQRSQTDRLSEPEPEVPLEEQARLMKGLLDQHYRKWIDEPIPMFAGRTPRQMAQVDPAAVSRAIWGISNPGKGTPRYDADWMYAELGVPPLGAGPFAAGTGSE